MVCQSTSNSYSHHYSAGTRTLISCSDGKISHTAASALVSTKATQLSTTKLKQEAGTITFKSQRYS